jgi:hypothetical protein
MLNQLDRQNYLRGLLLLTRDSKHINDFERSRIKEVCRILQLNQDFVKSVIDEFTEEQYVVEKPPKFTNHELAEVFLKDGIRMAFVRKALHLYKLNWLSNFAVMNDLSKQWFYLELEFYLENSGENFKNALEIETYVEKEFSASGNDVKSGEETPYSGNWN